MNSPSPATFFSADNGVSVGIDATNLRLGGGVTHLVELLGAANPADQGISRIVVWGGSQTLARIENRPWLTKINPSALNQGLVSRILWQVWSLSQEAKHEKCDVLFIPGGSYIGRFAPVVSMSQNLLPFDWHEICRMGPSISTFKMLLLRWVQTWSFQHSSGVIFLTRFARDLVLKITGPLTCRTQIVPHGIDWRFNSPPKEQFPIESYGPNHPFRVLYVSNIAAYKHQEIVIQALSHLRNKGYALTLDLIGPSVSSGLVRLQGAIKRWDPLGIWVNYHGQLPHQELHQFYLSSDLGVFASSCETFGITVLEKMVAGLPLVCSNKSSLPEVALNGVVYFDPESVSDLVHAIELALHSPSLRTNKAFLSQELVRQYSWTRCAQETFTFLVEIARSANLQSCK